MSSDTATVRRRALHISVSIRNRKDAVAGLVFLVLGISLALASSRYDMGNAQQMGPGFVPFWLAVLLGVAGAVVLFNALGHAADDTPALRWDVMPALRILVPTLLCGFLLPHAGMVVAITVLVLLSSRASREFRWRGALVCALVIVLISLAAFRWMLDLPLPVWPPLLTE